MLNLNNYKDYMARIKSLADEAKLANDFLQVAYCEVTLYEEVCSLYILENLNQKDFKMIKESSQEDAYNICIAVI